jgi:hypothetical protein
MRRNLLARLRVLEKKHRVHDDSPSWLAQASELTEKAARQLHHLLGKSDTFEAAASLLIDNMHLLAWCASRGDTLQTHCVGDFMRWPAVLVRFLERTPDDMRLLVVGAIADRRGDRHKPDGILKWLVTISQQRSRLPADISPDLMRQLLTLLHEQPSYFCLPVCDACGLERPMPDSTLQCPKPDYFKECPHCGCSKWTWNSLTDNTAASWKDLKD